MKKVLLVLFLLLITSNMVFSQVEKGDSEINFLGYYSKRVGTEYSTGGYGSIMFHYAYFITRNLQIGIGPTLSFSSYDGETDANISGTVFMNFNFSTASKTVPYVTAQWYQWDLSPESGDFLDYSYVNAGVGLRNFFNQYMALNTSVTYGFSLSEYAEGGMLKFMVGLSFIF